MDSTVNSIKCRVCGEIGQYSLWEMKFNYNDSDVMLIDAFNCFSTLDNNSPDLQLCYVCTESLTTAYLFWQQIKQSDDKFRQELEKNAVQQNNENDVDSRLVEFVDVLEENNIIEDTIENHEKQSPTKRKRRKSKSKLSELTRVEEKKKKKIGVNIALPHFVIVNSKTDDPLESNVRAENEHSEESNRKKIKTLKPSAIIPPDLERINELCMSPMEIDDDKQSIYKCSHCPKAFAAPHHLMIHMRKSHMCQYCLSTFSKINDLYSHVKQMHQIFACLLCSKEFQSNGNLRQHMRKNHSIFLPAHISLLNISDISQ